MQLNSLADKTYICCHKSVNFTPVDKDRKCIQHFLSFSVSCVHQSLYFKPELMFTVRTLIFSSSILTFCSQMTRGKLKSKNFSVSPWKEVKMFWHLNPERLRCQNIFQQKKISTNAVLPMDTKDMTLLLSAATTKTA